MSHIYLKNTYTMGCSCKSKGTKKQASQVTKRSNVPAPTHTISRAGSSVPRKKIVIRRPAR